MAIVSIVLRSFQRLKISMKYLDQQDLVVSSILFISFNHSFNVRLQSRESIFSHAFSWFDIFLQSNRSTSGSKQSFDERSSVYRVFNRQKPCTVFILCNFHLVNHQSSRKSISTMAMFHRNSVFHHYQSIALIDRFFSTNYRI